MSTLVSDIINQAFLNLNVIQPGETITSAEQTDAFLRLNQLIASLGAEGAVVQTETVATFTATAGVASYTLGVGGSWNTGTRAQRVVAWKITSGNYAAGGAPMDFASFDAAAQAANLNLAQAQAQVAGMQQAMVAQIAGLEADLVQKTAALAIPFYQALTYTFPTITFPSLTPASATVPMVLGADTAYPLINVRVYPAPSGTGSAEITYWTPITAFSAVSDVVSLPPGFELLLHSNLAVQLYPQYGREGGIDPGLAALAQNSRAAIIAQNSMQPPQAAK